MNPMKQTFAVGIAVVIAASVAGCSKSSSSAPPADTSTTASTAAPAAAPAPAAPADTTAAPAPAATDTASASAPAAGGAAPAGKIKLDIKDDAGNPVYGDPVAGKAVFVQCQTCHTTQPGVNKVGPSLHGIINRHSGMIPGFNYSAANKNSGKVWTEQELYKYLKDPQKDVPGTYMTFTGVKDDQKRADVIAFLQENTK